jgi:hypothetical protein
MDVRILYTRPTPNKGGILKLAAIGETIVTIDIAETNCDHRGK